VSGGIYLKKDLYTERPWNIIYIHKYMQKKHIEFIKHIIRESSNYTLNIIYTDINNILSSTNRVLLKDIFKYYSKLNFEVLKEFKCRNQSLPKFLDNFRYYIYKVSDVFSKGKNEKVEDTMKSKKDVYMEVINILQNKDHNGSYDLLLEESENNLDSAIINLYNILHRFVHEERPEDEELQFYKDQLVKIGILKSQIKNQNI
jgi:hypothetical protein